MKNFKRIMSIILVTLLVITLLPNNLNEVQAAKTKLNKTSVSIQKGNTFTLELKNNDKSIKWSSSNKKIATVNSGGVVTSKKVGTCKIYAKVGKTKYTCKVTVENNNIFFNYDNIVISKGNNMLQMLRTKNKSIKSSDISWSSSNKKIATVDKDGDIKAKKIGSCTITANYKNIKYKCNVNVVNKVKLYNDEYITIYFKESAKNYMAPSNSTNGIIVFQVYNKTNKTYKINTNKLMLDDKTIPSVTIPYYVNTPSKKTIDMSVLLNNFNDTNWSEISSSMSLYDSKNNIIDYINFSNIKIK